MKTEHPTPEEVLKQVRTVYQITGAPTYKLAADCIESESRRIAELERQFARLALIVGTIGKPYAETVSKTIEIIAEIQ